MPNRPLLAFLLLSGCAATTVQYAQIAPVRPHTSRPAADVAVLFREPTCTFEELGLLEVTPAPYGVTLQDEVDLLRAEGGRRGANAIIMLGHNDTSGDKHHSSVLHAYSALAISITACPVASAR